MKILGIISTIVGTLLTWIGMSEKNNIPTTPYYERGGAWGASESVLRETHQEMEIMIVIGVILIIVGIIMLVGAYIASNNKNNVAPAPTATVVCLRCGKVVHPSQTFCDNCGNNIQDQINV